MPTPATILPFLLILITLVSLPAHVHTLNTNTNNTHYITTWTAAPQLTEPANLPPPPFNLTATSAILANATLRQTLRLTLGARDAPLRLRVSNAFGAAPLVIDRATIALPTNGSGSSGVDVDTLRAVTFEGGEADVSVPAGAGAVSDPINGLGVDVGGVVAVSLYLGSGVGGGALTGHPGSRTTTWVARGDGTSAGDLSLNLDADDGKEREVVSVEHWYLISALETLAPARQATLAVLGDSLTDGRGTLTNSDTRWPDQLFALLQRSTIINTTNTTPSSPFSFPNAKDIALANLGIGGNRVLADGLGPSMLARLERDILAQPGMHTVLIFGGINDMGTFTTNTTTTAHHPGAPDLAIATALIRAYAQLVARLHGSGILVLGATLTPFKGNSGYWGKDDDEDGAMRERARQRVNAWVRDSGVFDAVADFDVLVRDEDDGGVGLRKDFDSGDGLHLNAAGYGVLARGVWEVVVG